MTISKLVRPLPPFPAEKRNGLNFPKNFPNGPLVVRFTFWMNRQPVFTFEDIKKLLEVIQALVDKGNTVIIIEHNLDVIKTADWIIDIGPEGGSGGGMIIAEGTPEDVANTKGSFTGEYLKKIL